MFRVLTASSADGFYIEHEWMIDADSTAPDEASEENRRSVSMRVARDLHAEQYGVEPEQVDVPDAEAFRMED